ncbi:hypothetical protein [Geotalea sp. SG265]|nr:hypothetical protein [Geotalea sp. SG265]
MKATDYFGGGKKGGKKFNVNKTVFYNTADSSSVQGFFCYDHYLRD